MINGAPIAWQSKLQSSISHSTAEAEIRALNACSLDALWLRRMIADMTGRPADGRTPLHCDNRAAEMWTRNPHHHARQKHIERCDLSIREQVNEFKTISVHLVPTQEQLADCLTKSLPLPGFKRNVHKLLASEISLDKNADKFCSLPAKAVLAAVFYDHKSDPSVT